MCNWGHNSGLFSRAHTLLCMKTRIDVPGPHQQGEIFMSGGAALQVSVSPFLHSLHSATFLSERERITYWWGYLLSYSNVQSDPSKHRQTLCSIFLSVSRNRWNSESKLFIKIMMILIHYTGIILKSWKSCCLWVRYECKRIECTQEFPKTISIT